LDQFSDLLKRLPADLDLDALALETKAIQRKRKLDGGASLLRLALARGPGGFSLRQTSGWVSLLEIAELSNPGVHYRLKQAVAFLAAPRLRRGKPGRAAAGGEGARRQSALARPWVASGGRHLRQQTRQQSLPLRRRGAPIGESMACSISEAAGSHILN
jgi:hypothetical protein